MIQASKRAIFLLITGLSSIGLNGQSDSLKNFKINAFPIVYYLPESSFGFGGVALTTFRFKGEDRVSRPSSFQLGATYTLKNQVLFFLPFELYRNNQQQRYLGELGYYKYFYNYYGTGIQSNKGDRETYDVLFPRFRLTAAHLIAPDIYAGITYQFDQMRITGRKPGGLLETQRPEGWEGGRISNLGIQLVYDTRDHIFYTHEGTYIQLDYLLGHRLTGSDFSYSKYQIDARYFIPVKKGQTVGLQWFHGGTAGNPPFFDLFYLGTPLIGRGISDRRYLDRFIYAFQGEFRFDVIGRWGGVVFSTINSVSAGLFDGGLKPIPTIGAGIRYAINVKEKNNVRLDVGWFREGVNFYLTASNVF